MPEQSYFDAVGWSRSELVKFLDSREAFKKRCIDGEEPERKASTHFEIGDQLHLILQEPDEFARRLEVIPASALTSNGQRRGNAWQDWLEDQPDDVLAMTAARLEQLEGMRESILQSPTMRAVLAHEETIVERPVFWSYTAANGMTLDLKAEPDLLSLPAQTSVDIKTTKDEGEAFRWAVSKFRYWMQDAHYSHGIEAVYGFRPQFVFGAIGKVEPYRFDLWELPPGKRVEAARRHVECLNDLALCLETGDWSEPEESEIKILNFNF